MSERQHDSRDCDEETEYTPPTLRSVGRLSKVIREGGGPSSDNLGDAPS